MRSQTERTAEPCKGFSAAARMKNMHQETQAEFIRTFLIDSLLSVHLRLRLRLPWPDAIQEKRCQATFF